jgi:hypothetical protein
VARAANVDDSEPFLIQLVVVDEEFRKLVHERLSEILDVFDRRVAGGTVIQPALREDQRPGERR